MVFSVSLVCLQFVLGIVAATYFVRRYNLLGPGYYWVMYSSSLFFSICVVLSLKSSLLILSAALILANLALLIYMVKKRSKTKEKMDLTFEIINAVTILLTVTLMLFNISQRYDNINISFETIKLISGGLLIGGVTTLMLAGHWYLVKPGMSRKPLEDGSIILIAILIINTILWLIKPSMINVLNGSTPDGWGGTLGYMWVGSVLTTLALLIASRLALKERGYTATMATTGLLYLAVLISNGAELIPRVIFS